MDLIAMTKRARTAAQFLATADAALKSKALQAAGDAILADAGPVLAANQKDVEAARAAGLSDALVDRLMLNEKRLAGVVNDLRQVAGLPDPVGEVVEEGDLTTGLHFRKVRVPMGVMAVIYEARPNVTVDTAGIGIKAGSSVILRGGKETLQTNTILAQAIQTGLESAGFPGNCVQFIADSDRALVLELLKMDDAIDLVIPRGGAGLHQFCRENSRIPVITGGIGICHLYVDESARLEASIPVIRNAKVQRPSVCNALDTLLVHEAVARQFIPQVVEALSADGVRFRLEERALAVFNGVAPEMAQPAGPDDFDTEWLSLVLGIKVVSGLDEAISHISQHSTHHSDGIMTETKANADRFVREVDSAAVYVNASTRFTDGAQLGLGAEVAVSTQRMHARGPMGLRELCTYKWVLEGDYLARAG
ncbi:MAG: glutamate-5-semialdehyde dehydrogenase [Anaerolineae bacterium]|nr:glutamate-5-semialdehyde dehydrogenase [Anaerolineae bacterium]